MYRLCTSGFDPESSFSTKLSSAILHLEDFAMTIDDIDEDTAEKVMKLLFKRLKYNLLEIVDIRPDDEYLQFIPSRTLFLAKVRLLKGNVPAGFPSSLEDVSMYLPVRVESDSMLGEKALQDYESMPCLESSTNKDVLKLMFSMLNALDDVSIRIGYIAPEMLLSRKDSLCSLLMKADLQDDDS